MASIFTAQYEPVDVNRIREDLIKSTEAHQAIEDSYGELSLAVSQLDKMLDLNADKELIEIQKNYINNLKNQVDVLSNQGLNPNTRKALIGARDRYASEIVPIQDAIARRKEAMTAQQKKAAEDPDIRFDEYASNKSVTDFYNNPTLDVISNNYSGKEIRSIVAAEAANLKNWIERDGIGALKSLGLPYQYQQMLRKGYSPEEVMRAAMADPAASPKLLSVIDRAIQSTGISKWKSAGDNFGFGTGNELYNWAWNAGAPGLYNAVGTSELKNYTDNYSADLAAYINKKKLDTPDNPKNPRIGFGDLVTQGLVTQENLDEFFIRDPVTGKLKLKNEVVNDYLGKDRIKPKEIFVVDEKTGKVRFATDEEIAKNIGNKHNSQNAETTGFSERNATELAQEKAKRFKTVLTALGIDPNEKNLFAYKNGQIVLGINKNNETINTVATRNSMSTDVGYTRRGTIGITLGSTGGDSVLKKLQIHSNGVREITGLNEDLTFKKGDIVDLTDKDIKVLFIGNVPASNEQYAIIQTKDGRKNVTVPAGVFGGAHSTLSRLNADLVTFADSGEDYYGDTSNTAQAINTLMYQSTLPEAEHFNSTKPVLN